MRNKGPFFHIILPPGDPVSIGKVGVKNSGDHSFWRSFHDESNGDVKIRFQSFLTPFSDFAMKSENGNI